MRRLPPRTPRRSTLSSLRSWRGFTASKPRPRRSFKGLRGGPGRTAWAIRGEIRKRWLASAWAKKSLIASGADERAATIIKHTVEKCRIIKPLDLHFHPSSNSTSVSLHLQAIERKTWSPMNPCDCRTNPTTNVEASFHLASTIAYLRYTPRPVFWPFFWMRCPFVFIYIFSFILFILFILICIPLVPFSTKAQISMYHVPYLLTKRLGLKGGLRMKSKKKTQFMPSLSCYLSAFSFQFSSASIFSSSLWLNRALP